MVARIDALGAPGHIPSTKGDRVMRVKFRCISLSGEFVYDGFIGGKHIGSCRIIAGTKQEARQRAIIALKEYAERQA
jgi:hypothetical protein